MDNVAEESGLACLRMPFEWGEVWTVEGEGRKRGGGGTRLLPGGSGRLADRKDCLFGDDLAPADL